VLSHAATAARKEVKMAKTKDGKKIVEVRRHKRRLANGKIVVVPEYRRSTPT